MNAKLGLMACALACSGCVATMAPLLNTAVANMSLQDVHQALDKGQQLMDSQRDMPVQDEIALGAGIASNMLGAAPLWQDKKAQHYVNQLGQWLARQTERADLAWHFAVLDDAEFNAFAAPGGYVFITRGLLQSMRNEAELAGVLSHEIAHVVRKHHVIAIKKAQARGIATELGAKGATLLAQNSATVGKYRELTPALAKMATAGMEMYVRGLDQGDEFEADRMGVVIAARAGYDPYGLPAALQTLQTLNPQAAGLALMFRTHPTFAARLDMLAQVMGPEFDRFDAQPVLAARFKSSVAMPKTK